MRLYTEDDQSGDQAPEDNYFHILLMFVFLGFLGHLVINVLPL